MSPILKFQGTTLGYMFQDQALLEKALQHKSHAPSRTTPSTFERLEFLGDRVLGLVISHWLYVLYPEEEEGALALRQAALIRREALVEVAHALSLEKYLKFDRKMVARFKEKILADSCEALIGALFVEGGFSLAEQKVRTWWKPLVEKLIAPPQNYKSLLQEWVQEHHKCLPHYEIVERAGPDHSPQFHVQLCVPALPAFTGEGVSRKEAEQTAAQAMLAWIKEDTNAGKG